jgi:hypothetical protein
VVPEDVLDTGICDSSYRFINQWLGRSCRVPVMVVVRYESGVV